MFFTGPYRFFDYKYDIAGYTGQDFGGAAQIAYLLLASALLILLLTALKNTEEAKARRIVGVLGLCMTALYAAKTAWESIYDIQRFGAFNTGLLPFDMCSVIMPAAILTGFGKGRIARMAAAWVSTGGIVGGLATMVQLNAFRYYPFFSFGACYSMLWHLLMVFMGLLLMMTRRSRLRFSMVLEGYLFHVLFSLIVIPVDFACGFDFMFYRAMGDLPVFSSVAAALAESRLPFLIPLLMLMLYFLVFCLVYAVAALLKNRKKPPAAAA